jgi:hypothetical protein
MKDCKNIHPLLSLDLEGVLSKKEKALVEKHLAVCITARREKEQFERMRKTLQGQPEPPVPADLHARIMSRLGLAAQETPKVIPWKRPFLLAAAMLLVVVFMDRLPEWKADALRPDPEGFAPQPGKSMEQEVPAERMEGLRQSRRDRMQKKKETRASEKKAPPIHQPASMEKALGKDAEKDGGALGMAAADSMVESRMEENAPALPPSTAPAAKSSAAPASVPGPSYNAEGVASSNEAERSLNTLKLTKEFSALYWKGDNGPTEPREALLTDAASFSEVWRSLRPGQKEPAVDLEKDTMLYLAAGPRPTGGYQVVVLGLQEGTEKLVVRYKVQAPTPGTLVTQVVTHPWALQAIPKPTQPIIFVQEE